MFMQLFFLKFIQRVTILQMLSNQEVTLNRLISLLWIAQKLYVGALSDLCEMYKLFIQQCGQGIRLLDKKHFCLYRKKFMQVRAFERYIPLIFSSTCAYLCVE